VRESLFGMLADVEGASVLDLFAGTGALGIEAISRGAGRAVFVERDSQVARVLRENLASLELDSTVAEVRRMDVLQALRSARGREETYDLVFIDPPYRQAPEWGPGLSSALSSVLGPAARVVVESDRRAPLELDMEVERTRRYGDTSITIHRHT
jgi:16S rRNA (guanine966-N2)-methyltransferase